ncbi:MAG: winged helix DNA-binding protein [Congregibacter sp.]|nr:winged helix DNA-binding protein [Congregibacter sp.]
MPPNQPPINYKQAASDYLHLFYPFHYQVGFAVENALRGGQLTQQQTVILWIIHSEGGATQSMRRKDIEARITAWFDLTSSAVSKALRSMATDSMPLLKITEDPRSGREKLVTLTKDGERFIQGMVSRSVAVITRIIQNLSPEDVRSGMHMLARISEEALALDQKSK